MTYLLNFWAQCFEIVPEISATWVNQAAGVGYFIISVMIAYRVFWHLNKISIINKIFAWTTLTHYYRRYHDPETRLKDMKPQHTHAKKR